MSFHRIGCKCCGCCSATACTACDDDTDCTPETFGVTIPALTFPAGCQNCAIMIGGSPGSWQVVGTWGEQTFCLSQASGCSWEYQDNAYATVVIQVSEGEDCADAPCYETHLLKVSLTITGGNARVQVFLEHVGSTCSSDPTNPGAAGFLLFDSIVSLASLPRFCRDGGSFPGVDSSVADACGFISGYDNPWATIAGVTATVTPCCEVGI